MDIKITPKKLSGKVVVPPSKSVAHRMIIAAALSDGVSTISNLFPSVDITATMACFRRNTEHIIPQPDAAQRSPWMQKIKRKAVTVVHSITHWRIKEVKRGPVDSEERLIRRISPNIMR